MIEIGKELGVWRNGMLSNWYYKDFKDWLDRRW